MPFFTAGYVGVSVPVVGVGIILQHLSPRVTPGTTETTLADTAHATCMDELCTAHGMPTSAPMNCRVTRSLDHASRGELH